MVPKTPKAEITDALIDSIHDLFCSEMQRLFNDRKASYGLDKSVELTIL